MLLFYYGDETARQLDCYAWFYWDRDNLLKVQYGSKQPWYVDKDPADGSGLDIDGDVIFNPEQWQVPTPDVTALRDFGPQCDLLPFPARQQLRPKRG